MLAFLVFTAVAVTDSKKATTIKITNVFLNPLKGSDFQFAANFQHYQS
jgi:hypothetical protein